MYVVEVLLNNLKQQFLDLTRMVVDSQKKKRTKTNKILDKKIPEMKFPSNPGQYMHNVSGVNLNETKLEALSLGCKLCDLKKPVHEMNVKIPFEKRAQTVELVILSDDFIRLKSILVDCCFRYSKNV